MDGSEFLKESLDLSQTSSGVGLHWRGNQSDLSSSQSHLTSTLRDPLPPILAKTDCTPTGEYLQTHNSKVHDRKFSLTHGPADVFIKAPSCERMTYCKQHAEEVGKGDWKIPLRIKSQKSECQAEFCARKGISKTSDFYDSGSPAALPANTTASALPDASCGGGDAGLISVPVLSDMYITSNMAAYRRYSLEEIKKYTEKTLPTYWQCIQYPTAFGHQTHEIKKSCDNYGLKIQRRKAKPKMVPLPLEINSEKLPMIDTIKFRHVRPQLRQPNQMIPVPHGGLSTETRDSYTSPADVKCSADVFKPVCMQYPKDPPVEYNEAPQMYKTDYHNIGSRNYPTV